MSQPKQRLLYIHARTPNLFSEIIALNLVEPVKGFISQIQAEDIPWPYRTVHDALVDGWQVVQFPHLQAPINDDELDVLGYEFILQKLEVLQ